MANNTIQRLNWENLRSLGNGLLDFEKVGRNFGELMHILNVFDVIYSSQMNMPTPINRVHYILKVAVLDTTASEILVQITANVS